jgi:2-iminobutanoate/2-iminopropanoate deaminase
MALDQGAEILARDGYAMRDVTRIVFLLRDTDSFPACFPLLREAFGTGRPATTLHLVPGFADAATLIEIELVVSPAGG